MHRNPKGHAMCDACVINAVKDRMLSRRAFFGTAVGAGAAAALSPVGAPPAMAMGHGTVEDLTHAYDADFHTYFGAPGISTEQNFNFADHGFNLLTLTRQRTYRHPCRCAAAFLR